MFKETIAVAGLGAAITLTLIGVAGLAAAHGAVTALTGALRAFGGI